MYLFWLYLPKTIVLPEVKGQGHNILTLFRYNTQQHLKIDLEIHYRVCRLYNMTDIGKITFFFDRGQRLRSNVKY